MDKDSFIIHIKSEDSYNDIKDDAKKWFDTSNYSENDKRSLPRGMNKKLIGLMKDQLGEKVMIKFVALGPKTYSYFTDDDNNVKKTLKEQRNV